MVVIPLVRVIYWVVSLIVDACKTVDDNNNNQLDIVIRLYRIKLRYEWKRDTDIGREIHEERARERESERETDRRQRRWRQ